MSDPERFVAYPDPAFHADEDPDPNFVKARERKLFFFKSSTIFFQNLTKLMCNFISDNAG